MYVSGSLLTRKIDWLVNTGCNVTILSGDLLNSLAVQERPKLKWTQQEFNQADSIPLEVLGKAEMPFRIGQQKYHCRVRVVNCLIVGLLGMNFFQDNGACLDFKEGTVELGGQDVPSETVTVKAGHHVIDEAKTQNPD